MKLPLLVWNNHWGFFQESLMYNWVLEYASIVWDPIYNNDVHRIENIQRRAARWIMKDYSRYSSVTSMLQQLSWPELQTRHKISNYKHSPQWYSCLPHHTITPTTLKTHWVVPPPNLGYYSHSRLLFLALVFKMETLLKICRSTTGVITTHTSLSLDWKINVMKQQHKTELLSCTINKSH